jgi:hypothetical protein
MAALHFVRWDLRYAPSSGRGADAARDSAVALGRWPKVVLPTRREPLKPGNDLSTSRLQSDHLTCNAEEFTMTNQQTLRSILQAADPDDCEDAAIRESICVALGVILAIRPSVEKPTADDGIGLPGFWALEGDQRFSRAPQDCLLSAMS